MTARQLIDGARAVGATLSLDGDRVRCKPLSPSLSLLIICLIASRKRGTSDSLPGNA